MSQELFVAGGGIAGLAAALAARRAGWETRLFEQAQAFSEVGAGIQLGPNVTRILREWNLLEPVERQAWRPPHLRARDGVDNSLLATLSFADVEQRYGVPYLTLHRADLQAVLIAAAQSAGVHVRSGCKLLAVTDVGTGVRIRTDDGPEVEAVALLGADGLWSTVRAAVCGAEPPQFTGHLAYRGLVARTDLPPALRGPDVTVWLAPRMHLVSYPVRGGEWLNVVCVVEGSVQGDPRGWDQSAVAAELESAVGAIAGEARELLRAVPAWRLWDLHDRAPVTRPEDLARGRIALLGDAAHPLLPYLAQGAGMAIEDARELERVLAMNAGRAPDAPAALRRYALSRWQRVAEVQRRSRRNGVVFHATGPMRWGRNLALRVQGARLLDQPWLYGV